MGIARSTSATAGATAMSPMKPMQPTLGRGTSAPTAPAATAYPPNGEDRDKVVVDTQASAPSAAPQTFKPVEVAKKAAKLDDDFDFDFDDFEKILAVEKPKPKPAPMPIPEAPAPASMAAAAAAPAAVPSTGYPSVSASANGGRTHFGSDDFASMDPVEALENKTRMQKFQNVASFGSDDFFGRETEQPDGIDYGDLREKVADKVSLGIAMGGNIS